MKGHTEGGDFHPHNDKPGIHSSSFNHDASSHAPGVQTNGKTLKVEEPEYYTDKLDRATAKVETDTKLRGAELATASGISEIGLSFLLPIIDYIGYNGSLEFDNTDWEYIMKTDGEKGIMAELEELKKRDLNDAMYKLDKEFGYDESNDRPKNDAEKSANKLWHLIAVEPHNAKLEMMKDRESDYARSKKIVIDVIDFQFASMHKELPRK